MTRILWSNNQYGRRFIFVPWAHLEFDPSTIWQIVNKRSNGTVSRLVHRTVSDESGNLNPMDAVDYCPVSQAAGDTELVRTIPAVRKVMEMSVG